jgi:hypothetical protein
MSTIHRKLGMRKRTRILKILARILGALVLLAMALGCAFGFLASFEPGNGSIWKVGYGALICGFLVGAVALLRSALKMLKLMES